MIMPDIAVCAENPDTFSVIVILAAFTVSFVFSGIVTYRIRKNKRNKNDRD